LVFGQDPSHIFPIKIVSTETVGALRDAIKEKKKPAFDQVPADELVLWHVSILVDDHFKENLKALALEAREPLLSVKRLSGIFPAPLEEHVHVIVRPPLAGECDCLLWYR
jgi:hypothetical protein